MSQSVQNTTLRTLYLLPILGNKTRPVQCEVKNRTASKASLSPGTDLDIRLVGTIDSDIFWQGRALD